MVKIVRHSEGFFSEGNGGRGWWSGMDDSRTIRGRFDLLDVPLWMDSSGAVIAVRMIRRILRRRADMVMVVQRLLG